jgi:hypothetical protein
MSFPTSFQNNRLVARVSIDAKPDPAVSALIRPIAVLKRMLRYHETRDQSPGAGTGSGPWWVIGLLPNRLANAARQPARMS